MLNLTDADFLDQLEEVAKRMHPDSYLIPVTAGHVAAIIADFRTARQERDQAREALKTYGEHRAYCTLDVNGNPCTCGLAELIAAATEEKAE